MALVTEPGPGTCRSWSHWAGGSRCSGQWGPRKAFEVGSDKMHLKAGVPRGTGMGTAGVGSLLGSSAEAAAGNDG